MVERFPYKEDVGSSSLSTPTIKDQMTFVIWSFIFAPKADYRMPKLPRTIIIVLLSIAIGLGLYLKGDLVFGLVILIGATLLQIVGQYFVAVD